MRIALALCIVVVTLAGMAAPLAADDFRIETKVYAGKDKVSHNTTLFEAGYVYDYLSDPERVAVFDQHHGRFIVLDPVRKVKSEVKTDDVRIFAEAFREQAKNSSRAFMNFAAAPDFQVDFEQSNELTLTSDFVTYKLTTIPANTPEASQQYREFSDWYARFNAMSNPGAMPPFPRMAVNDELAKRALVPTQVHLTIAAAIGAKAVSLRSEHHVAWRLLPSDHKKIAETGRQLATFKSVDFSKFGEPAITAKKVAKGRGSD
jgi:hypothetical protein